MSYILDALKKAEKERGLTEIPTLETVHGLPAGKKTGVWIAAGCGALCLIAAVWLFFPASSEPLSPVEPNVPASSALNPPEHGAAAEDSRFAPENRGPVTQSVHTPDSENLAPAPPITEPAKVSVDAARETRLQDMAAKPEPELSSPNVKTKPSVSAITDAVTQKSQPDYNRPALAAPAAEIPAAARQEPPKTSGNLPSLREIAASMNISVHIYSENPDERMVFINRNQYREGARLEHDCVLESITPEGVILRRGEETFAISP
jgi:general secretion pathway protein B